MAKAPFCPEWSQNGWDSSSPNGHEGRIPDRLGAVFQGRPACKVWTGELLSWHINGLELRACLPGTDSLSPLSQGVSCDRINGQHGGTIPYKSPGGVHSRTPMPSPPLDSRQVPLLESGSCSGSLEPRSRLSVKTESQVGGVDVDPSNISPDLGFVWQSGRGSLCVTGVDPMPALVLPEFPSTSGHRCVRSTLARHEAVLVSARQADSGSPVQGEGDRCPSPTHIPILAIPDVVLGADSSSISAPLGDSDQAGPALSALGQDLALGSCTLPNGRSFESWCLAHAVDTVNCPIGPVLEFLQ